MSSLLHLGKEREGKHKPDKGSDHSQFSKKSQDFRLSSYRVMDYSWFNAQES